MSARNITPPNFDHHAEAIQDPTLSNLDRLENRPWVAAADFAYNNLPDPVPASTATENHPAPDLGYQDRPSRWKSLAIGLVIGVVVLALLVVAVVVAQ